jgi:hypothetical protein
VCVIHSPNVVRARSGRLATEQGLIGLAAGTSVALTLLHTTDPAATAPLVEPSGWILVGLAGLGIAVAVGAQVLEVGEAPRRAPVLGTLFVPLLGSSLLVAAPIIAALLSTNNASGAPVTSSLWLWLSVPGALCATAILALRSASAHDPAAPTTLSQVSQPIGHALLGGLATVLIVGLISGQITAHLTYQLGVAITAVAAATIAATGLCVRRARSMLHAAQRGGGRFPVAEQAYRLAAGTTVLGLLLPAVIVVADLLAARVTLLVLAAVAMTVSNHAMRFALVACELSIPSAAGRASSLPARV